MALLTDKTPNAASTVDALVDIFDTLEHTDGTIHRFDDYSVTEKIEFIESLSPSNYEKLIDFLDRMPTVSFTTDYTCDRCKTHHTIKLSGLSDFLG